MDYEPSNNTTWNADKGICCGKARKVYAAPSLDDYDLADNEKVNYDNWSGNDRRKSYYSGYYSADQHW